MESKSFLSVNERTSSSFEIARRYAKHLEQHYLRYGEQSSKSFLGVAMVHHQLHFRYIYTNLKISKYEII